MQSMGVTQKSYSYCKWKSRLVLSLALADIALSTDACFNLLHATSSDPEGCNKKLLGKCKNSYAEGKPRASKDTGKGKLQSLEPHG